MAFQDKVLQCSECGADFAFTAAEQEFYVAKGFANEPKRCPACRRSRRAERSGNTSQRQMYPAVCASCGKETEVPFEPRQGRPVYCSNCYNNVRAS